MITFADDPLQISIDRLQRSTHRESPKWADSILLSIIENWSDRHFMKVGENLSRIAIWLMGIGYLFIEVREVVAAKQLANITIFALLFILASHQLSHCRLYLTLRKIPLATRCYRASCFMFIASLMAVFDASLDFLIGYSSLAPQGTLPLAPLLILGRIINLFEVILAIRSMELFLPVIFNGPTISPEDWNSDNVQIRSD